MISGLLKIIDLFCRISSLLQSSFAKETYVLREPTNRSHPILTTVVESLYCIFCPFRNSHAPQCFRVFKTRVNYWAAMGSLPLVGSLKLYVSFAKEPYKRDDILRRMSIIGQLWGGYPARPYESCKIFKGRPRRNAFSNVVHRQHKSFPPYRFLSGGNQEHNWVE